MMPIELFFERTSPVAQHIETRGHETDERLTPSRLSFMVMRVVEVAVGAPLVLKVSIGPAVVVDECSANT
jgi:hypothetical protein